jgi:dual specificity tyrosine-phosphorylation-regulated kinase 2/3/4
MIDTKRLSLPIKSKINLEKNLVPDLKIHKIAPSTPKAPKKSSNFLSKSFKVSIRNNSTRKSVKENLLYKNIKYPDPQEEFDSLDLPIKPETVLEKFYGYLNDYEKKEVLEFDKIYYLPLRIPKIMQKEANSGKFDDDLGNYILMQGDSIGYRFEVVEILGRGSFSQVCKCLDHKKSEIVAVKIIKSKPKFTSQANTEIRLLENINNKDLEENSNIIHLKEYLFFRGHPCLVFELLSMNLYELIKENEFKGLSIHLIRKIASQLLCSLKFLKSIHVIHCDLKPENVLLKSPDSFSIKLVDFGSGCYEHERVYSYIQSRFYRSPEVLLGIPYTTSVDIWSLGCILAELYIGRPLFPAENEAELMSMILEIKDTPPLELINKASRKKIFFDRENRPRLIVNPKGKVIRPDTKKLEEVILTNDTKFLDFIQSKIHLGCLAWDPKKRLTPEEGLRHEWIAEAQQKNMKKLKVFREMY